MKFFTSFGNNVWLYLVLLWLVLDFLCFHLDSLVSLWIFYVFIWIYWFHFEFSMFSLGFIGFTLNFPGFHFELLVSPLDPTWFPPNFVLHVQVFHLFSLIYNETHLVLGLFDGPRLDLVIIVNVFKVFGGNAC